MNSYMGIWIEYKNMQYLILINYQIIIINSMKD